jgi:carboxymethylenebutenolidase
MKNESGVSRLPLRSVLLLSLVVQAISLPNATPVSAQTTPVEVTFPSGKLVLHGFVYKPEGKGPFPAVLWNHGSEPRPGWLPELGPIFTGRGYVLFIPHRRGQGRSPGEYILNALERADSAGGATARSHKLVELMETQLEDQIAALSYLKRLSFVNAKRTAVAGCSFGGIQTILAAERGLRLRGAFDFAGAAQTWQEAPELRDRMLSAVRKAAFAGQCTPLPSPRKNRPRP